MENKKNCTDNVNHPKHYEGYTSLECIEVMQLVFGEEAVRNFCLCNAFKYLWRYKNKNGVEDIQKAGWYLDHVKKISPTHILRECKEYNRLLHLYLSIQNGGN